MIAGLRERVNNEANECRKASSRELRTGLVDYKRCSHRPSDAEYRVEIHSTPSLGILALVMQSGESDLHCLSRYEKTTTAPSEVSDSVTASSPLINSSTLAKELVDDLPEGVRPGAVAVRGVDATSCGDYDEFSFSSAETVHDNEEDESPITARLVSNREADVEILKEQLQKQEEQLRQHESQLQGVLLERANVPVAEVMYRDDNYGTSCSDSRFCFADGQSRDLKVPTPALDGISSHAIHSLTEEGYPRGLAEAMAQNISAFPLRIWVIDNSGSMATLDGSRLAETSTRKNLQYVQCTRWNELRETAKYHAEMAALLKAPTVFRLLNDPGRVHGLQQFSIAERGDNMIEQDTQIALKCLECSPGGMTPLSNHIRDIREKIIEQQQTLNQNGTSVAIVIATDAIPTKSSRCNNGFSLEEEFVETLRSLEGLRVWVVIRLCTNDEKVVRFYNSLDSQLEYNVEVLDDFMMEAREIYAHNKFLNYALPLHRCREMGYHHRLFDFIDERPLCKDELLELFTLLFGQQQVKDLPSAHSDWKGFLEGVKNIVDNEEWQWNPITKKVQPWVNVKKLDQIYGRKSRRIARLRRPSRSSHLS